MISEDGRASVRLVGLVAGPALAMVTFLGLPEDYRGINDESVALTTAARATLSLVVWMAVWWLTEAIHLSATALLPLAVLPLSGAASMAQAAAPYASEVVFLIMGGFILALSMQRWGLDRRIALFTLRLVGDRPANIVGGVMLATALMGGFVSNTAKATILLPVGLSVIEMVRRRNASQPAPSRDSAHLTVCILLGIAYAASISGASTLIGTPPNAFLAGFVQNEIAEPFRQQISFATWLVIGVPLAGVFLLITWLLLTRVLFPLSGNRIEGIRDFVADSYEGLGKMNRGEWWTLTIFALTAACWMCRHFLVKLDLLSGLTDAGIAVIGALLLFVIPTDRRAEPVMNWPTASKLPWGILILFGGGMSLAAAIEGNGVAEFLASQAIWLRDLPPIVLLVVITTLVVAFSEVASNTATATTAVPILASVAPGVGVHPYFLIVPATLAASFAFMLPAGTPPNAMVFGTGHITMRQMCWAGIWLNLTGVILVVVATYALVMPVLATH